MNFPAVCPGKPFVLPRLAFCCKREGEATPPAGWAVFHHHDVGSASFWGGGWQSEGRAGKCWGCTEGVVVLSGLKQGANGSCWYFPNGVPSV